MALTPANMTAGFRVARVGLTTADADALAAFYQRTLGFVQIETKRLSGTAFLNEMISDGGASCTTLRLGDQWVELLRFDQLGKPYPNELGSADPAFQHFAIVVRDMAEAYRHLTSTTGWSPISTSGPVELPPSSGGVTAFKFRDPEGHPLELLAFPAGACPAIWRTPPATGLFLGIDHSAIGVADTIRSEAFYRSLGFTVSSRSHNKGPEQDRLDGLSEVHLDVTGLSAQGSTPHIELLCYARTHPRQPVALKSNDIAATRIVLESRASSTLADAAPETWKRVIDPDGHHLLVPKSLSG